MQLLRRGDSGPAVVEIRSTLRRFGLLTGTAEGSEATTSSTPTSSRPYGRSSSNAT